MTMMVTESEVELGCEESEQSQRKADERYAMQAVRGGAEREDYDKSIDSNNECNLG